MSSYAKKNRNEGTRRTAYETALAYLDSRMRTVQEMRRHLSEKGYSDSEIEETIKELLSHRYLDDASYAIRYFEYNRSKHRGGRRAVRELEEKGLDRETISNAYEDFLFENKVNEFEDALELAEKEKALLAAGRAVDDRFLAKLARKLESAGYEYGDIHRVLDRMRRDND